MLASIQGTNAGETTCVSRQMEWYSSVVGESPCVTYERLRQICNPDSACCCNTVAFQLSMLCMNCQYDTKDGGTIGMDAARGTYGLYKRNCGAGTNHSLPADIQRAVCNKDIRLDDFVYGGWDDGAWFYVWTKQNAVRSHNANNNNTFTRCPNQISPSVTPIPVPTTQSTSRSDEPVAPTDPSTAIAADSPTQANAANGTDTTSQTNIGAIVGGVFGGAGALVLAIAAFMLWRVGRGRRSTHDDRHGNSRSDQRSPAMASSTALIASEGGHGRRDPDTPAPLPASPMALSESTASWARTTSFMQSPAPTSPDASLRHEDGGPVGGLVRSGSGRLPPAYHSWEHRPSTNGAGSGSVDGSQISETHTYGGSQSTNSNVAPVQLVEKSDDQPLSAGALTPLRRTEGSS
ncbi:hypothetical protein C8Q76DRAFT_767644 [Earliella scabrosa]|nr:hypothetical protein C8Q76DRAFT_767644 [Earliella scabrosa]